MECNYSDERNQQQHNRLPFTSRSLASARKTFKTPQKSMLNTYNWVAFRESLHYLRPWSRKWFKVKFIWICITQLFDKILTNRSRYWRVFIRNIWNTVYSKMAWSLGVPIIYIYKIYACDDERWNHNWKKKTKDDLTPTAGIRGTAMEILQEMWQEIAASKSTVSQLYSNNCIPQIRTTDSRVCFKATHRQQRLQSRNLGQSAIALKDSRMTQKRKHLSPPLHT